MPGLSKFASIIFPTACTSSAVSSLESPTSAAQWVFSLITLPVEFDASKRALAWLKTNHQIVNTTKENEQAKDALWWAAMTYVVAALGSLANLIYYASILFGREKS